ncbi:MAG: Gldg family protein [Anaerolineae bacterium]|nr:Gldg family protein [Anaerolineae bacterium]
MNENGGLQLTRGQLGQLGIALGSIGLIVTASSFLLSGLSTMTIAALIMSVVGFGLWGFFLPDEFRAVLTGRQMRNSTAAILSTAVLIGIVVTAYIVVQRANVVGDMTIDERFTLSDPSLDVVDAVIRNSRDIQITAFYNSQEIEYREVDDQYFQLFEEASNGRIHVVYVDPDEQPGLAATYANALDQGIYVFASFIEADGSLSSTIPVPITGYHEQEISQRLAILLASGQFTVYFERGLHTLDPIDNQQQGMSVLNNIMRQNGLITNPISLAELAASNETIPEDASALIIAQPHRQMTAEEVAVLDEYLQRGGSVFIAADAMLTDDLFMAPDSVFNTYMWDHFGLRMTDMIVVDPASSGESQISILSAQVFTGNDIGENINLEGQPDTAVQFQIARAIEVNDSPPVQNGRVIMSSPESWGERDWNSLFQQNNFTFDSSEGDVRDQFTTVAWAYDDATDAKVVLVGDGDFLTNGRVQSPQGNATLFLDSIGWMTGFTEEVQFQPRSYNTTPVIFVGGQMLDTIAFFTIVVMPGSLLLIALAIWLRRTRQ